MGAAAAAAAGLGGAAGRARARVLRGPQHAHHHVAAARHRAPGALPALARRASPRGADGARQPALPLPAPAAAAPAPPTAARPQPA